LNTGTSLDIQYQLIVSFCIKAQYKQTRNKIVGDIRALLEKHPHYRELIIERLTFDLSEFIEEKKEDIKDKDANGIGVRNIVAKTNGIQHIIQWITDGLGKYKENALAPVVEAKATGGEIERNPSEMNFNEKENKFNSVPLSIVIAYFMQLAEARNTFLTKKEVEGFVNKAFCEGSEGAKIKLSVKRGEQQKVWKLFFNFYSDCTIDFEYETAKQGNKAKYVKLITDNFRNWEYKQVADNFSKSNSKYWKSLKEFNT